MPGLCLYCWNPGNAKDYLIEGKRRSRKLPFSSLVDGDFSTKINGYRNIILLAGCG